MIVMGEESSWLSSKTKDRKGVSKNQRLQARQRTCVRRLQKWVTTARIQKNLPNIRNIKRNFSISKNVKWKFLYSILRLEEIGNVHRDILRYSSSLQNGWKQAAWLHQVLLRGTINWTHHMLQYPDSSFIIFTSAPYKTRKLLPFDRCVDPVWSFCHEPVATPRNSGHILHCNSSRLQRYFYLSNMAIILG
jgi:hypothetical protein